MVTLKFIATVPGKVQKGELYAYLEALRNQGTIMASSFQPTEKCYFVHTENPDDFRKRHSKQLSVYGVDEL